MNEIRLSRRYRRVIQLELNEISRPIVDKMVREGELPNFAALDREALALQTTSEQKYEHLEPWIQWTTAHTGKSYAEHGIFRLGDARLRPHEQTWEVLSRHGIESAILGSMNAYRGSSRGGLFFPDPWAKSNDTHPTELAPLWSLISRQVQGHAVAQPSVEDAVRGALACLKMRVPLQLQAEIALQIARQRLDRREGWRMAELFDRFLFAVFREVLRSTRFGYYTLFLNSVAHYQHHFWREFDRTGFAPDLRCPDCKPGDDPVRHGYRSFDRMIGDLRAIARERDTLLIVLSGLSQEPYLDKDSEGGCNYWRLRDHRVFAEQLGLGALQVYPMMSRDWQLEFADENALAKARALLESCTVGGEQLFAVSQNVPRTLFVESALTRGVRAEEMIVCDGRSVGRFHESFVCIAIKSGKHVGTGMLWIADPSARAPKQVSLTSVHRTVLTALGVEETNSAVAATP